MTCTECGTRNVEALPGYGTCQKCLKARAEKLERTFANQPLKKEPENICAGASAALT